MPKAAPVLLLLAAACYVGPPRYYQGPPAAPASAPAPAPAQKASPAPSAAAHANPPPPSPPPPVASGAPKMLVESEAVASATTYARSRGFVVGRVRHVHLDGAGRWHVDLVGENPQEKARLLVDGWTGQVLKASMGQEDD